MVTKLSDGRGQITLKGHPVTDEWETLVKTAAKRNGQAVADFVVTVTRDAAQTVLKGGSAVPAALPAKPEEVMDRLAAQVTERFTEEMARQRAEQDAKIAAVAAEVREQTGVFAELRRSLRRGKWR
jgi:uncharacterized protein (DUF1778 family)